MVELVIKIPKEMADRFKHEGEQKYGDYHTVIKACVNGTPLPKGHGRLIDADALNRKDVNCANVPMNFIDTAPTIIEADNTENGGIEI